MSGAERQVCITWLAINKMNTSQLWLIRSLYPLYYILDSWRDIFSLKVDILIMT